MYILVVYIHMASFRACSTVLYNVCMPLYYIYHYTSTALLFVILIIIIVYGTLLASYNKYYYNNLCVQQLLSLVPHKFYECVPIITTYTCMHVCYAHNTKATVWSHE